MREIIEYKNLKIVDIVNLDENDFNYLKQNFNFHPITYENIVQPVIHPDLDIFKKHNYIFFILQFLIENENEIEFEEIDFIIGPDYIILNHKPIAFLENFFKKIRLEPRSPSANSVEEKKSEKEMEQIIFQILNKFLKENLQLAERIEKEVNSIEKEIFSKKQKEITEKVSYLKRKIIDVWRIMEPERKIFKSLKEISPVFFKYKFRHHFFLLWQIYEKIEYNIINSKATIESLEKTNSILVTMKLDETIKILTVISLIFMPLTLIASMWGMNTNYLPFKNYSFDFWLVILLMFSISLVIYILFKKKNWL